jgi:serine/threonine protein kinase
LKLLNKNFVKQGTVSATEYSAGILNYKNYPCHEQLLCSYESKSAFAHLTQLFDCSLKDLLLEPDLEEDRVRTIIRQVLIGVRHLHASGLVHKDIKPENVLVRQEEAALCVLGFPRVCPPESSKCTVDYVSPSTL